MVFASETSATKSKDTILTALVRLHAKFEAVFEARDEQGSPTRAVNFGNRTIDLKFKDRKQKAKTTFDWSDIKSDCVCPILSDASTLAVETEKEPRYNKKVWPKKSYEEVVRMSLVLYAYVAAMEDAMDGADGLYVDIFRDVRDWKVFE